MFAEDVQDAIGKTADLMRNRGWTGIRCGSRSVTGHGAADGERLTLRVHSFRVLFVYVEATVTVKCGRRVVWDQVAGNVPHVRDVLG